MLRAKLYDAERQRQDAARAAERRGQVGSGDRSERIRTYNFPQGRVTDHRINLTLYKLPQVMEGEALGRDHRRARHRAPGRAAGRGGQRPLMEAPPPTRTTSIGSARRALAAVFRDAGFESPELDARVLVGHALRLDQAGLIAAAERELLAREAQQIAALAERRLARESVAAHHRLQGILGPPLQVSHAALVPRPDTETVVEAALRALDASGSRSRALHIADLGTGTGCLLLALLSELPRASGIGIDISPAALAIARENARALGLADRAQFLCGNFTGAIAGRFDLIVSNPPYIATHEFALLSPEVRREPRLALDGGVDGLQPTGQSLPTRRGSWRLAAPSCSRSGLTRPPLSPACWPGAG